MKTVSVVGVTGFRNRGVEALVRPIVSHLLNAAPTDVVNVFSWTPDFDHRRIGDLRVRFHCVGNFYATFTPLERVGRRLGFPARGRIAGWEHLLASDLVIFTGGDCLSSEYGDVSFWNHTTPLRLAAANGIPFVLHAQSMAPFGSINQRRWWDEISTKAAHISVREPMTQAYLAEELSFPINRMSLVADPAFVLEASPEGTTFGERLRSRGRPLIGVALSQGIASWTGTDATIRHSTWEYVLRRMLNELGAHVVLVPHVQETHTDDSMICHEMWKRFDFTPDMTVLAGDFSATEYKGVLSRCDMVVAERMHAGIAALSSGVATAIVAYSVKARGLLQEMVGPQHCRGKALIEGEHFHSPTVVWSQIERVWNDRQAIESTLATSVPKAKSLATEGLSRLREFMR